MAATLQAQRVADALKALGLKQGSWKHGGDFTVRTDIIRRRDRRTGLRYSEFGDAMAHCQRSAFATVETNAQALADQGLQVILLFSGDRIVTVVVSSKLNRERAVSVCRDGKWTTSRKPGQPSRPVVS